MASDETINPSPALAAVKEIFADTCDLPPDRREAYLRERCGENAELRSAVDLLLKAHDQAGPFFGQPTREVPTDESPLGQMIGRYKLLQRIGEGGFGTVYMAEQETPVRRRVAMKIIKLGMDTKAVIARFEAERQALAMMDHPNIAKVFDAGATDSGRPYFVMELVHGIPITEYCDTNKLSTRERLELFIPVCRAVQHAHQKGIIHRDIKPSNVLVTLHDGAPVPKVIDFGIAKATSQRLTEKTLFTEFRQFIGTPEYMSPEQAEMSGLDIDTRSDIFALGVLLYELLTGTTPFDAKALRSAAYAEIQRMIREVEPPKPSARISGLGATLAATAARRGIDSRKFGQLMRGELDWIVMKCMEKDRTRRYETASGVAADIQRYLGDEAVEASPPSTTYRLRKLARKYRRPLRAAMVFAVLLIIATIFSSWEAVRATRARAAALVEKQRASDEAAVANRFAESLQQMLGSADPTAGKGLDYTVRQLLDDFAAGMESRLSDQPEVLAALHATMGNAYSRLGQFDQADLHLDRALELRRQIFGVHHEKYADSLVDSAWESVHAANNWKESEAQLREALVIYRANGIGGRPVFSAISALTVLLQVQERWKDLDVAANEALAEARKSPGVEYSDVAGIEHGLVAAKIAEAEYAEAERLAQDALGIHLRLEGPRSLNTGWSYAVLGGAFLAEKKFPEAISAQKQALAIFRTAVPANNPAIGNAINGLGTTVSDAEGASALIALFPTVQDLTDLEPLFRPSLAMKSRHPFRNDDPPIAAARGFSILVGTYLQLSRELSTAGRSQEAEESRRRGMALVDSLDPNDRTACRARGQMYVKMGQPEKGLLEATKVVELDPNDDSAWDMRGNLYCVTGQFAKMAQDYSQALVLKPDRQWYWHERAFAYMMLQDYKKAIADHSKTIELGDTEADERLRRGSCYQALGDFAKAEADYSRAIELDAKYDSVWAMRGETYRVTGQFANMAEDYSHALQLNPQNQHYWHERAYAYTMLGDHKKAIADDSKTIELGDTDAGERMRRGNSYEAVGELAKAEGDYSRAIELNPGDGEAWWRRGRLYIRLGEPDKANADVTNSIAHCANNPDDQNALAWDLATAVDPQMRDPKTGVELAEKAVAAKPEDGRIWNTLGVAQYRAGNWPAAVHALNKSMELRNGGDGFDWFFLAMANYQLEKRDEARQWYDRAAKWADEKPRSEELHRFRAEAEALIGPSSTTQPASQPSIAPSGTLSTQG